MLALVKAETAAEAGYRRRLSLLGRASCCGRCRGRYCCWCEALGVDVVDADSAVEPKAGLKEYLGVFACRVLCVAGGIRLATPRVEGSKHCM